MSKRYLNASIGILTLAGVALGCTAKERDWDKLMPHRGGTAGESEQASAGTTGTEAGGGVSGNEGATGGSGITGGTGTAGSEPGTGGDVGAAGGSGSPGTGGVVGEAGMGPQAGSPPTGGVAGQAGGGQAGAAGHANAGGAPPGCVPSSATEVLCKDFVDDDCDGLLDCDDDDCALNAECVYVCVTTGPEVCNDLQDNDCDGDFDCQDSDCETDAVCSSGCVSTIELICNDTVDDDCNGFTDCDDEACTSAANCLGTCVPTGDESTGCSDNQDNDCDGYTDCFDSECAPTAACCLPTVPSTEVCADGVDNNCDGIIDCPVILDTFPEPPPPGRAEFEGGAAAGEHVFIQLAPPAVAGDLVVQCRTAHRNQIASAAFRVCDPTDPAALDIWPIPADVAAEPALNGRLQTQIRYAYPNGAVSQIAVHTYYVHNSLSGLVRCPVPVSDADYFDAARPALSPSVVFSGSDARLAAPFVNIEFAPPVSGRYQIAEGDGTVELLSLRRRFVLDPENRMILMKRVYPSRRSGTCLAGSIRKHQYDLGPEDTKEVNRDVHNPCDAIVLNKAGAGVCILINAGVPTIPNVPSPAWVVYNLDVFQTALADNFMWRKLVQVNPSHNTLRLFSPKCYVDGELCTGGDPNVLFLPDRALFPALNP